MGVCRDDFRGWCARDEGTGKGKTEINSFVFAFV